MSQQPTPEETALWQRRLASQANNRAWTLSEQAQRSADEDEEMLQAAHAAMHLWKIVGNPGNRAHAAQLVAHVYALLGLPGPAWHYLAQCQSHFLAGEVDPWERALAHVVSANVAAARRDTAAHREHHRAAVDGIAALADPEDRVILEASLRVVPVPDSTAPAHAPDASDARPG
jgi:hypothetical protein